MTHEKQSELEGYWRQIAEVFRQSIPTKQHAILWACRDLINHLEALDETGGSYFQPPDAFTIRWPRLYPEWGTFFLFDPEAREALDEEIRTRYFPAVLKGLEGTQIQVHHRKKALSKITDLRDETATRRMTFLLTEPPRPPSGPKAPPWYVQGNIDRSLELCMIHFNLTLSLPLNTNIDLIQELMNDDRLSKDPPKLSVESRIPGSKDYTLKFLWGRGYFIGMESLITKSVKKHVKIIEAINQLEKQWDSHELFTALIAKIIAMYGNEEISDPLPS